MYGYDEPTPAEVREVVVTLSPLGVTKIEVEFSGGNDEGGVDDLRYLDAEGKPVDVPRSNAYERTFYRNGRDVSEGWKVNEGDWREQNLRDATPDEVRWARVAKIVEAPIYARYYSFAGEFHVYGTLTWDVVAGTYAMHGQESHEVWEDF